MLVSTYGRLPSTPSSSGVEIGHAVFASKRSLVLLAVERHLRPLPRPIDLQIEDIVSLIPTANNIMKLLWLDASIQIEVCISDAFFALDLIAYWSTGGIQEQTGALCETVDCLCGGWVRCNDCVWRKSACLLLGR